jgi:flagellar motility protein MotE (MotC chaperone)
MQLQDTIGKVSSRQYAVSSIFCSLLLTTYCLLFTAYYVSAQQPAAQQRSLEEERLNILRADIKKEIERLEKLKKEIEEAQKALDSKVQESLLKVAKMYEAMPAEEAARKLEKLDEDTALIILTSLKPKTAGKILAQMENERAASLSKKIIMKGKVLQEKTSQ